MRLSVLSLHPIVITGTYFVDGILTVTSTNIAAARLSSNAHVWVLIWAEAAMTLITISLTACWIYETARLSANQAAERATLRFTSFLATAIVIGGVFLTLLLFPARLGMYSMLEDSPILSAVGFALGASYLIAAWLAASLLSRAERRMGDRTSAFVAFLQILYLPFGVWWLKPRIERLREMTSAR